MSNPLILTIDLGSQSLRAALINKKGEIVGIVKKAYEPAYISKEKGQAEQDPDAYYNYMIEAIKELVEKNKERLNDIKGVCLDTVRDTGVILDKNFKPLHNSILWLDQRLAKGIKKKPLIQRLILKLVGMDKTLKLNTQKSMSVWYKENLPDLYDNCAYYCNISSYLTYKLTGEYADSPASLIGHYPFDFKKRRYMKSEKELTNIYMIPINKLPKLVPVGENLGYITKEIENLTGLKAGIPLISCGSDKSCESLGVGCLESDVAAVSFGTASTVEVTTKKYYNSEPFLPSYPSCIGEYYNMDVQIYRGFWMINWFLKNFCRINLKKPEDVSNTLKEFNELMMTIPAGSDGLILQPYWQAGLSKPYSRGAVIGFTQTHGYAHFYKSIIEGICFTLKEALEHFEKLTKIKVKKIMVSGGGSQSDEICQVCADVFGLEVRRVQTFETSSLGAAIAGFIALKEFDNPSEAIKEMVHETSSFKPNEENHRIYELIFRKQYKKVYGSLNHIYKNYELIK